MDHSDQFCELDQPIHWTDQTQKNNLFFRTSLLFFPLIKYTVTHESNVPVVQYIYGAFVTFLKPKIFKNKNVSFCVSWNVIEVFNNIKMIEGWRHIPFWVSCPFKHVISSLFGHIRKIHKYVNKNKYHNKLQTFSPRTWLCPTFTKITLLSISNHAAIPKLANLWWKMPLIWIFRCLDEDIKIKEKVLFSAFCLNRSFKQTINSSNRT